MKLAFIIDDYLPYSTRVGAKMFHELACHCTSLGHSVTVITPSERQTEKLVKDKIDNVDIWYFSSGAIKDVSKVRRAINETCLSVRAWSAISHSVRKDSFDGVVCYSPSIFFGWLVSKIKRRCKCKAYLVLRDLFPQWVVDSGIIKKGSLIEKYFRYFEKYLYDQADIIGLMSERNQLLFNRTTNYCYATEVLRNWAEQKSHSLIHKETSFRKKLNLESKIIYFYGGNIGHAQDMANLMRLAKSMFVHDKAHFLFVGQGDEVELINRLAKKWKLENYTYLPSVSQNEFIDILSDIDIGLFSLSNRHTSHNFPGKILGYMAQSIPILGSVNYGNDLLDIINEYNAGMLSINGEDDVLYNNALLLYKDAELRKCIGQNAFSLLSHEFSVQSASESIIKKFEKKNESIQ